MLNLKILFNKLISTLLIVSVLTLFPHAGYSQDTRTLNDLHYADSLFIHKQYYQALWMYHRYLFFNPDVITNIKEEIIFKMATCYFKGEQYQESYDLFSELFSQFPQSPFAPFALFYQGKSLENSFQLEIAHEVYDTFQKKFPSHPLVLNSELSQVVLLLKKGDFSKSIQSLETIGQKNLSVEKAQMISSIIQSINQYQTPYSPVLAGIFSAVLPGAGQFYSGNYTQGLWALGLTGTFAGLSAYTFYLEKEYKPRSERNYWAPSVFGLITAVFYFSNIYNAANLAKQENYFIRKKIIQDETNKLYSLSIDVPILEF